MRLAATERSHNVDDGARRGELSMLQRLKQTTWLTAFDDEGLSGSAVKDRLVIGSLITAMAVSTAVWWVALCWMSYRAIAVLIF